MSTATTQPQPQSPFAIQKAKAPTTVIELLQNDGFRGEIAKVLPKHMSPERMLRVALTTAKMNDKLQKVTLQSFAAAMLKCSQYGLEPDGRHAHLIPFKNKEGGYDLNLIFDYKGLISLVRRSGDVSDVFADVVYEEDEFICEKGNNSTLIHRPNLKSKNRGPENIYAIYSFVKLKDGTPSFDVMTVTEINRIRDRSQGYQSAKRFGKDSVWDTDWNEMAKKTVFRRHTKWLPLSAEVKEAIDGDDDKLANDDERFRRAKDVSATVVAPDFSIPSDAPKPSGDGEAEVPPAESEAPPVPNEVLGAEAPKAKRMKKAEPAAEPEPAQTANRAAPPVPSANVAPLPTGRMALAQAIRDKVADAGMNEFELMERVHDAHMAPPGTLLTQLPEATMKEIMEHWNELIAN